MTKKEVKEFCTKYNITERQFNGIDEIYNSLWLRSLTNIPENFNPTVGGSLWLNGLTSIPENFNPTVGCSLWLNGLTSIPENFNPTVGGSLNLRSLTSIPENFNISDYAYKDINLLSWEDGKYISVDNIFVEVIEKKGKVYKVKKLNSDKIFFIVTDGINFSHGYTIKEAKEDLIYKISNIDKSEFKELKLDSVLSFKKAIECYRVITGACLFGVKDFVKYNSIKKRNYTVDEIIKITQNAYNGQTFKEFFVN